MRDEELHLAVAHFDLLGRPNKLRPGTIESLLAVVRNRELLDSCLHALESLSHGGHACDQGVLLAQAALLVLLTAAARARIVTPSRHEPTSGGWADSSPAPAGIGCPH